MFQNCLKAGYSPPVWNKASVSPVHKKGNKKILNNFRTVSFLSICGKIFQKIIFDTVIKGLMESKLLNPNQSCVMPGDSCLHQICSVIHEIYTFFDTNSSLEVIGAFLDLSKAFEGVWHEELVYKIKCIGVKVDLLWSNRFFFKRQQRAVLNEKVYEWLIIKTCVKGKFFTILSSWSIIFLIYIKDLSDNLEQMFRRIRLNQKILHCVWLVVTPSVLHKS